MRYCVLIILLSLKVYTLDATGITRLNLSHNNYLPSIQDSSGFGFEYLPNRFGVQELSQVSLYWYDDLILPQSISISALSNDIYNQFVLDWHLGYDFGQAFDLGVGIRYNSIIIRNFDIEQKLDWNISGRVKATDEIYAGFRYDNFFGSTFSDSSSIGDSFLDLSIAWVPYEKISLALGTIVFMPSESWFYGTISYEIYDSIQINASVYGKDLRAQIGVSIKLNEFLFNPNLDYHSVLGISQNYLIEYYY